MAGAPGCGLWGGNYEGVGGAGGDSPRPALPGPADRGRGAHGGEGGEGGQAGGKFGVSPISL